MKNRRNRTKRFLPGFCRVYTAARSEAERADDRVVVREILHAVSRAVEQLVAQRFGAAVEDVVDVERFGLAEAVVGRPGIGLGCLFAADLAI